ncbi:MAG: 1-acyl-sn-glycerol-3-phosphate acyltransferase [Pedobacter sp.]|nr:MAG: 1-acyl-sn-glycerol-3-phosphate acyltransferase [Pedobacter sp.]
MKKLVGILLSPIFYLSFFGMLCLFHPIQWVCYKVFGYKAHKKSVDILNFFLTYSQLTLLNSVKFINTQNLPLDRPIIFVSNHQSMYDIPSLIWFLRKHAPKFISKIELTKGIPSISFNLKYGGGANIDRKDSKQSVGELIKLGRRMKENNWSTVIFAEGTRAKDGKVKSFHVGGIATLMKVVPNALLVPVAIENSWKIVRFGAYPLGIGLDLKWTVLPHLNTAQKNPEEITLDLEQAIRKHLNQQ